ncbi:UNVERIFIED_CONTAM: protein AE7-like 1 [Sesamum radiatum]|uniref:Protein AE7-like 1 n=1 Tax=Sesamum radiatum TaxID=300843 RepID=A0AAW2RDZ9_SESRA
MMEAKFFRFLKIVGVGFKARAEAEGRLLYLKLGYSHEVELTVPPAVRVFCFKNNVVCCTGIDKGRVHQFAAAVRSSAVAAFSLFSLLIAIEKMVDKDIRDPEHPYSLEQLSVLSEESITVDEKLGRILITFTPTIQHCSMATVIGLCLREKLKDCFPPHFKVDIKVAPGSHANEESVNKQLNDKERVAAALENPNLRQLVDECLYSSEL